MSHAELAVTGQSASQTLLDATRVSQHARCLLCSDGGPFGPKVDFHVQEDGSVRGRFACCEAYQSYPGILHGGVISALLDAAMTNCLFATGVAGVTGELVVRFLNPVHLHREAEITAKLERSATPLYHLAAELTQDGEVLARATAKFVDREWTGMMGRRDLSRA